MFCLSFNDGSTTGSFSCAGCRRPQHIDYFVRGELRPTQFLRGNKGQVPVEYTKYDLAGAGGNERIQAQQRATSRRCHRLAAYAFTTLACDPQRAYALGASTRARNGCEGHISAGKGDGGGGGPPPRRLGPCSRGGGEGRRLYFRKTNR